MADLRRLCCEQAIGPDQLWGWPIERLGQALAWPAHCLRDVERYRFEHGAAPKLDVPACALLPGDPDWPRCLDDLHSPPFRALRRRGSIAAPAHPCPHGHRGCLARNGAPIAVLGTPLDRVYPAHHRSLQQQVGRQGLLISPSRSGCRVRPGHFAARNRWLVAFSQALVVVECPQRSGALISARWASRMQCPVWVVPGDARRWSCRGSNALLRDGATALIHPEDLLASIGEGPLRSEESRGKHQRLMEAIGSGATFDQLVLRLQCSPAELAPQLLALECRRELLCESGLHWRKPRP
ncbi:DNA-processing protein DprA [Synechococcus sp. UW86]|uniref:DNA-processing protein DprA n=1 Tax=Synechococcus sp. UW86 TaxID=368491 RepID=UPI000E0E5E71|nr:DNA-processing protein DprA [Synechococcus sp. UW86]